MYPSHILNPNQSIFFEREKVLKQLPYSADVIKPSYCLTPSQQPCHKETFHNLNC